MNSKLKIICRNGIVAAIYAAISYLFLPISFGQLQIRFAEALCLLCFFRRDYIIGVTVGCALANIYSACTITPLDMLIGVLATLLSCTLISVCKHLALASFIPVAVNGLAIGAELTFVFNNDTTWYINVLMVAAGELIAIALGYILFMTLGKKQHFQEIIGANRQLEFKW